MKKKTKKTILNTLLMIAVIVGFMGVLYLMGADLSANNKPTDVIVYDTAGIRVIARDDCYYPQVLNKRGKWKVLTGFNADLGLEYKFEFDTQERAIEFIKEL